MRLTKIICTLGPATFDPTAVRMLARGGMNVARLNFSHGTVESHRTIVKILKEMNAKEGYGIGILIDTKGAEIRTGDVAEPIKVKAGEEVLFSYAPIKNASKTVIRVDHAKFATDVRNAERLFVDNGELIFDILGVQRDGSVRARSQDDGSIGSRRHVNLPGADISMPSLAVSDWKAIEMGCKEGADFVALSFIRNAKEMEEVRRYIRRKRGHMALIAKIETRQAVANIDEIIEASDGIMVARGDLGSELPFQRIPAIQDDIVLKCRKAGKPVIVATHMLESMIRNPLPTRAEVTDVAHAATTRADSTMLSGETASGKYPYRALEVMSDVLVETEAHVSRASTVTPSVTAADDVYQARAAAAVAMAQSLKAAAIVVLTGSGDSARMISAYRPSTPIIACTIDPRVQRNLQLQFGVSPLLIKFGEPEATIREAFHAAKQAKLLKKKDHVVLVADAKAYRDVLCTVQARSVS